MQRTEARDANIRTARIFVVSCVAGLLFVLTGFWAPYEIKVVSSSVRIYPAKQVVLSPLFFPPEPSTDVERLQIAMGGPGAVVRKTIKLQWHYLLVEWVFLFVLYAASLVWIFRVHSKDRTLREA